MPYVTLQEASETILRETKVEITIPQLIRAGAVNGLPLCVLLDVKCYSPTQQIRRQKKAVEEDPDYWSKVEPKLANDLDYAYGVFVLPPRHVFAFQTKETVRIDLVSSLDGNDTYCPGVDISRDELQIMLPHLDKFIAHIKASQAANTDKTTGDEIPPVNLKGSLNGDTEPTPAGTPESDEPPAPVVTPADNDAELAALFDPVRPAQLEAMFPDGGKWKSYAERAKRNGLEPARTGRRLFNPYLAATWWIEKGPTGWTWERCLRKLTNNLPTRSMDSKHRLNGEYE